MQVVILCGGLGTRLREETEYKPKPMVEVGSRPIVWHIMKLYSSYGFKDFILCLGYKQHVVREYFLNYEYMNNDATINLSSKEKTSYHNAHSEDWNVTLVDTGLSAKKGERIKKIKPYITHDQFMLTYGDGIADVDVNKLIQYHNDQKKIITFTGVHPISRFATVETDEHDEIVEWKEKKALEGYINAGFFVLEKQIFDYLGDNRELEEEPLQELAKKKQVSMYKHDGFWHCMDTYRDYKYLQKLWEEGEAPWKVW